jgi:hypothetical protein
MNILFLETTATIPQIPEVGGLSPEKILLVEPGFQFFLQKESNF